MRIGIFGNTNNYPLLLAIGLRKLGHDAVLVVNRRERLHRPESKYPNLESGYPYWILDCSSLPEEDFLTASPRIGPVLDFLAAGSEALILNDLGPSLAGFCGLPAIALMTGSDLTYYAEPALGVMRQQTWEASFVASPSGRLWTRHFDEFVERQRCGIRNARAVSAPPPGLLPEVDALLNAIGVETFRRDFLYFADTTNAPVPPRREAGRMRVVNAARLNWKKPLPAGFASQDHKGTDVLLRGFAKFAAEGGDAELVLFRKGLHVAETEQLAESLGLSRYITWRAETTLREFYDAIAMADVVCDQLGDSFPGMVSVDAMALGVPVLANFRPDILGALFPEPIAGCHASTADDVAAQLHRLGSSPRARIDAGRAARRFARMHLSPEANARRCLRHLGAAQGAHEAAAALESPHGPELQTAAEPAVQ